MELAILNRIQCKVLSKKDPAFISLYLADFMDLIIFTAHAQGLLLFFG